MGKQNAQAKEVYSLAFERFINDKSGLTSIYDSREVSSEIELEPLRGTYQGPVGHNIA